MQIDVLNDKKIEELSNILKTNRFLEFKYKNLFYQVFESSELGYVVNVYSSNKKDENGDYIDLNIIDGGVCTGSAKDAITFMIE